MGREWSSQKFVRKVGYGAVAGCAAKTATAPLERVRILQQVGNGQRGVWRTLVTVAEREGVGGLWAGNPANLARIAPARGIAFATNDGLHAHLNIRSSVGSFVAGGASGLIATAATYPLDLVRGRQAGDVAAQRPNFAVAAVKFARDEGVLSLWRGAAPTLLGSIPFEGIRFGVVQALGRRRGDERRRYGPWLAAADGMVAGLVAGLVTFPNDTIRRVLQCDADRRYAGYLDCARRLGLKRVYAGLTVNLVKAVPSAGIQFGVFDFLVRLDRPV